MFDNNWYLFLLIILILFMNSDGIDQTESLVLIGIVAALLISQSNTEERNTDDEDEE